MPTIRYKKPKKITIIGSGPRACCLTQLIAQNIKNLPHFDKKLTMFVQEEKINGKRLSHIINETHENPKSLPGFKLPINLKATAKLEKSVSKADIIIFDVPFDVVKILCIKLYGKIKPTAFALSLSHGLKLSDDGGIDRNSMMIMKKLRIATTVLGGTVFPTDIYIKNKHFEATLGCRDSKAAVIFKSLLESDHCRITIIDDMNTIECCSALRYVVALPRGFGLNLTNPQLGSLIRIGLQEIMTFMDIFFPGGKLCTFFESCGIPSIVYCCQDTNGVVEIEDYLALTPEEKQTKRMWQKPLGVCIAEDVINILIYKRALEQFPLFTMIYNVCTGEEPPEKLLECFRNYSQDVWVPKRLTYQ